MNALLMKGITNMIIEKAGEIILYYMASIVCNPDQGTVLVLSQRHLRLQ